MSDLQETSIWITNNPSYTATSHGDNDRTSLMPTVDNGVTGCTDMRNSTLLQLPAEVQHNIYSFVDPEDLANMAAVCRNISDFIKKDPVLHKDIVMHFLDEPNEFNRAAFKGLDYKEYLETSITAKKILASRQDVHIKSDSILLISKVITRLLHLASSTPSSPTPSRNITLLSTHFSSPHHLPDKLNIEALLCSSTTFQRAHTAIIQPKYDTPRSYEERQGSAKMHVQYGMAQSLPRRGKYRDAYGFATSVVYDLRNFTRANMWGPYRGTGDAMVDWERLEAVMLVIDHNMARYRRHTQDNIFPHSCKPFVGATPNSFVHQTLKPPLWTPEPLQVGQDPYNITGTYLRVVCFLDFQDLFMYNFAVGLVPEGVPRPELRATEVVRIITMEIHATSVCPPEAGDHPDFPLVKFEGVSRSLHDRGDLNANSEIRGCVRMTREGEVRWSTISVYGGEERWKSEGIQVGGINSARGVLGHWFDKDYTPHGPVGPTMFWKHSNDIRARSTSLSSHSDEEENNTADVDDDSDEDEEGWGVLLGQNENQALDGDGGDGDEEEEGGGGGSGQGFEHGYGVMVTHHQEVIEEIVETEGEGHAWEVTLQ